MRTKFAFFMLYIIMLSACRNSFEPIDYGHDACAYCKMTIIDKRFTAEILTSKGKAYKFDDISCLRKYIKEENLPESGLTIFVADYNNPDNKFLDAMRATFLHNEAFKSPMNGCMAAFANEAAAHPLIDSLNILSLKWENLK
jgi:copper chaperone NosL